MTSGALAIGPGDSLAQYRVDAKIGQGGMGAVYRAFDARLQRHVALKVLPPGHSMDDEARHRLLREARAASALNHPNIVTVYEIAADRGLDFIAMEYVQGRRLDELITPKGLPVAQLLRYGVQIADALARAHGTGILHRDIKPSNIMVTDDGRIKVLDFGLAKLMEVDPAGDSQTRTALTRHGVIVGTVSYMSPEQAEGRALDARSDIFSLGGVLYEMATGRRPFRGDSGLTVMHKIAAEDPPRPSECVALPGELDALIIRCLRKDPSRRFQTMEDLKSALEDLQIESSGPRPASVARRRSIRRAAVWIAAMAAAAAVTFVAMQTFQRPAVVEPGRTVKFTITPADLLRGGLGEIDAEVSISPDGKHIAYVESGGGQLWIRDIDRLEARPVSGAHAVYQAFWSPDSRLIGFSAGYNCGSRRGCDLMSIPVQGGTPQPITKLAGAFRRASWSSDGRTIVFCDTAGMFTVPAAGGAATRVVEHSHIEHPSFLDLPGGRRAFLFQSAEWTELPSHGIFVQVEGEGERRLVRMSSSANPYPAYSATGHIVFVDGPNDAPAIWALPFSLETLEPSGAPFLVAQLGSSPVISTTGTLAYSDVPSNLYQLTWVDRSGTTLSSLGEPQRQFRPTLSPDGRRLAVEVMDKEPDLWVYELDRGVRTRVTFDGGREALGGWAPSGDRIVYGAVAPNGQVGIFSTASNGAGEPRQLVRPAGGERTPTLSPDGRFLLHVTPTVETQDDLLYRERRSDGTLGKPAVFLKTPFNEQDARFSPDGRFVAYTSDESGRDEVYVRDFPGGANKWQISAGGGTAPRWSDDGREIFYLESRQLMAASVTFEAGFAPGAPVALFLRPTLQSYDVSPDGRRFVVLEKPADEPPLSIHIVHNWFEEFRGR